MAVIRAMTGEDLEAVMRLEAATAEAPHWERAVYEGFFSENSSFKQIFVAREAGRLRGFAAGRVVVDVCELESIVVDAEARRTGIGKALMAALADWAREHHAARIEIEVRAGNEAAICFYEQAGFGRDGLRRAYYRSPEEDALLMGLNLAPGGGKLSSKTD